MRYGQIRAGEALSLLRDGKPVLAAISDNDPENGVIRLESYSEVMEFADALYIEVDQ